MKVSLVSFSGRENGNCDKIVDYIKGMLKDVEISIFKFSNRLNIHPCGNCDYRCLVDYGKCVYDDDIQKCYQMVHESDFSYWLIPNYSGVPCANYFIFRERSQSTWSKFPISSVKKHFIVISNTDKTMFQELLKNEVNDETLNIDFFGSNMIERKSINGDLIDDEMIQSMINKLLIKDGFSI